MMKMIIPQVIFASGRFLEIVDLCSTEMVVAVISDESSMTDLIGTIERNSNKIKLVSFIGVNSLLNHDELDDLLIQNDKLGMLTTYHDEPDKKSSVIDILNMSIGYDVPVVILCLAKEYSEDLHIMSDISGFLSGLQ